MKWNAFFLLLLIPVGLCAESIPVIDSVLGTRMGSSKLRGISPDGAYVVVADNSQPRFIVVEVASADRVLEIKVANNNPPQLNGYMDLSADRVPIVFSPDSRCVLVGDAQGFVTVYDLRGVSQNWQVSNGPIGALSVVDDPISSSPILMVTSIESTTIWNLNTSQLIRRFGGTTASNAKDLPVIRKRFTSAIHPSGLWAAESDLQEGHVRLFEVQTGNEKFGPNGGYFYEEGKRPTCRSISDCDVSPAVLRVGFDPSDVSLLVLSAEKGVAEGNGAYLETIKKIFSFGTSIITLNKTNALIDIGPDAHAVSSREDILYANSYSSNMSPALATCATLLTIRNDTDIGYHTFPRPTHLAGSSVAITPDGKTAAILTKDEVVRIWRLP